MVTETVHAVFVLQENPAASCKLKRNVSTDKNCKISDLQRHKKMLEFVLGNGAATVKEQFFQLEEVTCEILIKRLYQTGFAYGK